MTIDERLEAFAMNLELMQKHFEERMTRIETTLVNIEATGLDNELKLNRLTDVVTKLATKVDDLTATVQRYIDARGNGSGNGQ